MINFNKDDFNKYFENTSRREAEEALADYLAAGYAVAYEPGADSIGIALNALDIGDNKAVFIPEFPEGLYGDAENLIPVSVNEDFLINPKSFKNSIDKVNSATQLKLGAVIIPDTFGRAADFYNLKMIARDAGLRIIEDARDCLGGGVDLTGDGLYKMAGTYGEIGIVPGAFLTDDRKLYERLYELAPAPTSEDVIRLRRDVALLCGERPYRREIPDGSLLLASHRVYEDFEEIFGKTASGKLTFPSKPGNNFLSCTTFPIVLPEGYNSDNLSELGRICHFKDLTILIISIDPCLEKEDIKDICNRILLKVTQLR